MLRRPAGVAEAVALAMVPLTDEELEARLTPNEREAMRALFADSGPGPETSVARAADHRGGRGMRQPATGQEEHKEAEEGQRQARVGPKTAQDA
jgi:hypothetical protein